ncbi:MAG: hypothetical protein EON54_23480 [Alcaligenaceae bacterium]|uniref:hypothetical protein n=1 Tax=Acidovorax sp. LjRoot117 TaxID=3342255 RepID=UPI0010D763E3|nr:MAG: hypothetical protein EON54_23480 [Alcaligenaceae bacterium]
MSRIYELEVWSQPGGNLPSEYSKEVLQREMWSNGVPENIFLGLSSIPDKIDCDNLQSAIQSGEFKEKEFFEFCIAHQLKPDLQSDEAASKFLEYKNGRCLAWIHLPISSEAGILSKIINLLQSHGHLIIYPDGFEMKEAQ